MVMSCLGFPRRLEDACCKDNDGNGIAVERIRHGVERGESSLPGSGEGSLGPGQRRPDLGNGREGDFFRSFCADVKSNGGKEFQSLFGSECAPFLVQFGQKQFRFLPRAQEAEIRKG